MRLKIPIFIEIDSRPSPKEVEVLRNKLSELFTRVLLNSTLVKNSLTSLGKLEEKETEDLKIKAMIEKLQNLIPYIKLQPEVEGIEILDKAEFLNRIR